VSDGEFFVVVPFYNEAAGMNATLEALARQSDTTFSLVLVDNASTDASAAVAAAFIERHPELRVHLIAEPQKGTGAGADTGFRFAIAHGARFIARTDADCIPERNWVESIKVAFGRGRLEFVVGTIKPREDDIRLTRTDRVVIPLLLLLAENYGKVVRRGPQFKYPYLMAAGNNLAITADLYERAGGFPRSSIADSHEDRVLAERVRTLTTRAQLRRDVVVYNSIRRLRRYGYVNTLRWYANHSHRPDVVDVR
jgi:glycosyltransferase involved in cell wall biosynthesis